MIDISIGTYWNVETLFYVFNGVASIMGGNGFSGLLKMVFFFALCLGIFAYGGNRQFEMAGWFIQALIFTTLLNLPIARVTITDNTGLEPPRTVDHVPYALAIVAQTVNLGFGWATRGYETVFGVPEELGLQKGDLAFGHRILKGVNKAIIREPGLRADLMQFIKECTLYDIKDGIITPQQVIGETGSWNTIFGNTSPARFTTYDTLTPMPKTDTCTGAATVLKERVEGGILAAQTFYGRRIFTRADSDTLAVDLFTSAIGSSYDWILGSSATASDAMKQAMFNNLWRDAGAELPALMGDTARILELQSMAGAAQAARQTDGSNTTLAMLAQETLPHLRNWIEAIIFGMFPVAIVLMVVASVEGARKIIAGYMMSLAWVGMWPIMFAIINHLSLMHLRHKLAALKLAAGVPFQLSDAFDATLVDEQAAIGYLVVLVPFLCAGIIKMGQGGFMSVADRVVSGFSAAGASVGSSLASGNQSLGQTAIDTASVNSTSMHKYDSNIGLSGGGAVIAYGNGNSGTMALNGGMALQEFQNRMISSIGMEKRYQAERSSEGHTSSTSSSGHQVAKRHGTASSFAAVTGHDDTRGSFQNKASNAQVTESGSTSRSHETGQGLNHSLSEKSGFSFSAGANDNGTMSLNLGGSQGSPSSGAALGDVARSSVPARGRMTPSVAAEEKRIAEGMKKGGATEAQIDAAVKNYRGGTQSQAFRTITDDFGNLVKVPISGGTQESKPFKGPPSRTKSAGWPTIAGSIGFNSQKTYDARHGRDRDESYAHTFNEGVQSQQNHSTTGQSSLNEGAGSQSAQGDRSARDASLTNIDEHNVLRDVSGRDEVGVSSRGSISETDSYALRHDLLSDPNLMAKVAMRNDMTSARFIGQAKGRMLKMVRDYLAEKAAMSGAVTMPAHSANGELIPKSREQVKGTSEAAENQLLNDVPELHKRKIAKTGFSGVEPIAVGTGLPEAATATKDVVNSLGDPNMAGSIQQRAAAFDENVRAWASHDKRVGEGRANPMSVVEGIEMRDASDTVKKVWDKVTGGDGTADGERLNENKKRESGATIQINSNGKKK